MCDCSDWRECGQCDCAERAAEKEEAMCDYYDNLRKDEAIERAFQDEAETKKGDL
jgi:trimethylamine:corrinoid methyltransferase-like protein